MDSKNNKLPNKIGIFHKAGLGDWILLNPAIRGIKKRLPDTKIYILTWDKAMQYFLETEKNIDGYSILPDYSIFKNNFRYGDEIIFSNFIGFIYMAHCKQHWVNFALKIFNIDSDDIKPKVYLNQNDDRFGRAYSKLFKGRMVILYNNPSSYFKRWDTKCWERVIKEFANYVFVQIGDNSGGLIKGAVNMLGRTTLGQAMSLVKYSKLLVAVDGIFNHVAEIFDVPRVILWGRADPRNFGYDKNTINIWKEINCSSCLRITAECVSKLGKNKKCPSCMSAIKESEVINAIKKILKEKYDPNIEYYKLELANKNTCLACRHKDICNIDSFKLRFSDLFLLQELKTK